MEEFLKTIGIDKTGTQSESGSYVIDLDGYDDYGKTYSILEKAQADGKLEELEDSSIINIHNTDVSYVVNSEDGEDVEYEISLLGDLEQDIYKLVITKF